MQDPADGTLSKQDGPWLTGAAPASGKLARAKIRNDSDIAQISAIAPGYVLPGATIYDCVRAAAMLDPGKAAVIHLRSTDPDEPPRVLTFAGLLASIERAASLFREVADGQPSSVGIILPMVPEAIIAAWGASTAGIASPINPFLQPDHIASLLNAARVTALVVGNAKHGHGAWERLDEICAGVPTLRRLLVVDSDDPALDFAAALAARQDGLTFAPSIDPQAEATYLPTGGTTAAPKLVRMTHRGQLLMAWLIGAHAGAARDDVVGHAMPNFHVGGANLLTLRAVLFGQTMVTLTTDGFRNPGIVSRFWEIVRKFGVTSLIATPATAAAILAQTSGTAEGHDIRTFNCGGSTIPVETLRGFHQRFGVWLREIWGMSEFHGMVSVHPDLARQPAIGSVGRAVPWHRIQVAEVSAENAFIRECVSGERGNLLVSGVALTPGYVDRRFDDMLFVKGMPDGIRWANTGDLGTMDESGNVWIFGRAKDVIIRGGHNIDPKMIEDVLVRHPAVQIAAAVGQPDAAKGEMPIVYVQLKAGVTATTEELLALCRERVPERAAVPVEVIITSQIPLTAIGKVNKPALRADAMLRVARQQANAIVADSTQFLVMVDESGTRPRVKLTLNAPEGEAQALQAKLMVALGRFEFETLIDLAPVNRANQADTREASFPFAP